MMGPTALWQTVGDWTVSAERAAIHMRFDIGGSRIINRSRMP